MTASANGGWLGVDVGGANIKLADGQRYFITHSFPLWREKDRLAAVLSEMLAKAPSATAIVASMTGELADCFVTKAEGVRHIVAALVEAAGARSLWIYQSDGRLVTADDARESPWLAAAANWHALATFAAREVPCDAGLLIDLGSTTCDIIPLADGRPAATGRNDPERLVSGELVYNGVARTPICALLAELPWRGQDCPTAAEWFATTRDAYLLLGELPEEPDDCDTADGRPATRDAAHDRLAHAICADRALFDYDDALLAAEAIRAVQVDVLARAVRKVANQMAGMPELVITSGQGEFLLPDVLAAAAIKARVVLLNERLGKLGSRCATAHALAVLGRERMQ